MSKSNEYLIRSLLRKKVDRIESLELKKDLTSKEREFIQEERKLITEINQLINERKAVNLGKLPPQALDLEETVLGAVILESKALDQVRGYLLPEHFSSETFSIVYKAILQLLESKAPVDIRTLVIQLRKTGHLEIVGGASAIAELTAKVCSAANIEYYSRVLIELAIRRSLIRLASEILYSAYDDTVDVFDMIEGIHNEMKSIETEHIKPKKETA